MENKRTYYYYNKEDEDFFLKIYSSSEIAKFFHKPIGSFSIDLGNIVDQKVRDIMYNNSMSFIITYEKITEIEKTIEDYDDNCNELEDLYSTLYDILDGRLDSDIVYYIYNICKKINQHEEFIHYTPPTLYRLYNHNTMILAKPDLTDFLNKKFIEYTLEIDDYKILQCKIFSYVVNKNIYIISPEKEVLIKYDENLAKEVEDKIDFFIEQNSENYEFVKISEPEEFGFLRDLFY